MHIIGIVGGVASGKSLATEYLRQLGAAVLDGDQAGHEVLREPAVVAAASERWGAAILDADGQIDRSKLAEIVFAPTDEAAAELKFLEDLTHPRIRARLTDKVARLESEENSSVAVLDAPVLLKAGWNDFCQTILFVDTPPKLRLQRAVSRGWSEQDVLRREAAQVPIQQKRAVADVILDNSGPPEKLYQQILDFWDSHCV
jgi:dephospho-CoA kinase